MPSAALPPSAIPVRVPAGTTALQALKDAGVPLKGPDGTVVVRVAGELKDLAFTPDVDTDVEPVAAELTARAARRALDELPGDEFSVLSEPGTVGAALRAVAELPGVLPRYVGAALHHRLPELVPLTAPTTDRQLLPHLREGDSGTAAVVHRELRDDAAAFGALQEALRAEEVAMSRLRLHDVLLWLSATLRLPAAVEAGCSSSG